MTSELASRRPTLHTPEAPAAKLDRVLASFQSSSLEELERVELLNRTDTKFLLSESAAVSLLPALAEHYRILDISGIRQHRYRTIYFDTPDWQLYEQHRTAQPVRFKVRSREYTDNGDAFLEIKSRDSRGCTIKHRMPTAQLMTRLTSAGKDFIATYLSMDTSKLRMVIRNEFARVTMVHRGDTERLTLDFTLRFDHLESELGLPGIVIAEVKQNGFNPRSPFLQLMMAIDEPPSSLSKYCIGVARLHSHLDHEAFAPVLQAIENLALRSQ